jgi:hypothetical protein
MIYLGIAILWPLIFVVRLFLTLIGIPIVLIALRDRKINPSDRSHTWTGWYLVNLPKWAWLWDNVRDGARGDVRGKYWFQQAPNWADTPYLKMFNWLALRNPVNNFSRWTPILSVSIIEKKIEVLSKGVRHQFLTVGFPYCHLRWNFYKNYWLKCGHKLDLKYNGRDWSNDPQKARRGFTFRIDR